MAQEVEYIEILFIKCPLNSVLFCNCVHFFKTSIGHAK